LAATGAARSFRQWEQKLVDETNGNVCAVREFSGHASVEVLMKYDDNRKDMGGEVASKVIRRITKLSTTPIGYLQSVTTAFMPLAKRGCRRFHNLRSEGCILHAFTGLDPARRQSAMRSCPKAERAIGWLNLDPSMPNGRRRPTGATPRCLPSWGMRTLWLAAMMKRVALIPGGGSWLDRACEEAAIE
jgi:hypothetical protein